MKHIIMQHKVYGLYRGALLLSTVKIGNIYETALFDKDFEELQMFHTDSRKKAFENHRRIARECEEKVKSKLVPELVALYWTPGKNIEIYNYSKWEPFA